jgi:hypothetical protein
MSHDEVFHGDDWEYEKAAEEVAKSPPSGINTSDSR